MQNKIKVYRAMKNWTQEQLADRVKVTRQTIIAIEAGKYSPSLELGFRIAAALGSRIDEVFQYEGEK